MLIVNVYIELFNLYKYKLSYHDIEAIFIMFFSKFSRSSLNFSVKPKIKVATNQKSGQKKEALRRPQSFFLPYSGASNFALFCFALSVVPRSNT